MNRPTAKLASWLVSLTPSGVGDVSVFCFPYAGAGASVYRSWAKLLPSHLNAFAIQAPGRETRFLEPFVSSITELANQAAQAILRETEKPIVLFGHSLGAACAYETARALERSGHTPELLIVSGRQCPGTPSKRAPIGHLSDKQFIDHVRMYKGTPSAVLENKELMELLLPLLRADFSLSEQYRPLAEPLLSCPILGLGSTDDEWLDHDTLQAWENLTRSDFETHWFEGDHFYLNQQTEALLNVINEKISALSACMQTTISERMPTTNYLV